MATTTAPRQKTLQDPELKEALQRLRKVNNARNLMSVVQTWLYLLSMIALAVAFDQYRMAQGWSWAWDVPVFFTALVLIGAGQHHLVALGHEGSHHVLLRHRLANELVSDIFCMYPVFTTTHHYRLQHLAHHQFVNDPDRDPNFGQLQVNGYWTKFPITRPEFWSQLGRSLLPWNLLNYIRITAKYNSMPTEKNPYQRPGDGAAKIARIIGVGYFFVMMIALVLLGRYESESVLLGGAAAMTVGVCTFYALIPSRWFTRSRIHPTISMRWVSVLRLAVMSIMFTAIGWLAMRYGRRIVTYFFFLWMLPLGTSFSFFMMMRQLLQHSNGDRGWLTNTRVMFVNWFVRNSMLPLGQDLHLPHHLYATVPHYNLKELHDILMEYPEYRDQVLVVNGAVFPKKEGHYPTLIDMLGAEYAPAQRHAAFIDNSVLENVEVEEKDEILKAGERSVAEDAAVLT
ncbi:MAG: fatty acid desaturase [Gemmataceae bacterium]|nr:fatty acid desaturase [Gemmataceae bacterium]